MRDGQSHGLSGELAAALRHLMLSSGAVALTDRTRHFATSEDRALGATICGCDGATPETGCDVGLPASLATLKFMQPADVSMLNTCIQVMGCGQASACLSESPLGAAFACGC